MIRRRKSTNWPRASETGKYNYFPSARISNAIIFHSTKIAVEAQHGLIAQVLKDVIFSMRPRVSQVPEPGNVGPVGDVVDTAMAVE